MTYGDFTMDAEKKCECHGIALSWRCDHGLGFDDYCAACEAIDYPDAPIIIAVEVKDIHRNGGDDDNYL